MKYFNINDRTINFFKWLEFIFNEEQQKIVSGFRRLSKKEEE